MRIPDRRLRAAPSLARPAWLLPVCLLLVLPLAGCGPGSTIGTKIYRPSCECDRPLFPDEPARQSPLPDLSSRKKEKKVGPENQRVEGKDRVCRYDNNVVIKVAATAPCPTF